MNAIQQISLHLCLFTFLGLILRLRQTAMNRGVWEQICNIGVASLAFAYLQKFFARMEGDPADMVDIWREASLFLIVVTRVITCWHRHERSDS